MVFFLQLVLFTVISQGTAAVQDTDPVPDFLPEEFATLFESRSFERPGGTKEEAVQYQLFVPTIKSDQQTFPLIVYLHGHGRLEIEYPRGQLQYLDKLIFRDLDSREKYPFFLLAVQCPRDSEGKWVGWFEESRVRGDEQSAIAPAETTMELLEAVCTEYPINRERICLFGISAGGTAAWELALRYPDRFAAVAPLASVGTHRDLEPIKNVPVWAFHSDGDNPGAVRQSIDRLEGLGGKCHLTEIPSKEHNCWFAAFQDYDLLDWMLLQDRGASQTAFSANLQLFKFNYLRWAYLWPRLIPVFVILTLVYLYRRELRRTQQAYHSAESLPEVF